MLAIVSGMLNALCVLSTEAKLIMVRCLSVHPQLYLTTLYALHVSA